MDALLKMEQLCVDFATPAGMIHAVRDVSLCLYPGETLAVVGESGCGKSVLCKSIPGLLPQSGHVTAGKIVWQGKNLVTLSQRELERVRGAEIAMIFQNPASAFDPTMTIGTQLMEALRIHQRFSRAQAEHRALELMALVGLDKQWFSQRPNRFSGGMLQRAALASALSCSPRLLLADEPTAALDQAAGEQILQLVSELQTQTGIAVLLVTHDLVTAAKLAQRVAVMYAGKLVEIGTAAEVFEDPRHPYTWGLLESLPTAETDGGYLRCIEGIPPQLLRVPKGDAFAVRNRYALEVDYEEQPPMFQISETHYAATWLLHPQAPAVCPPIKLVNGQVIRNV